MCKCSSLRKWVFLPILTLLLASAVAFAQTGMGGTSQGGSMDGTSGPGSDRYKGPGTDEYSRTPQPGAAQESPGQYMDDSGITAKVKAALLADSKLKSTGISVETTQGVVRLTGTVDTEAQKSEAARVAKQVNGVRSVENHLTVSKGSR